MRAPSLARAVAHVLDHRRVQVRAADPPFRTADIQTVCNARACGRQPPLPAGRPLSVRNIPAWQTALVEKYHTCFLRPVAGYKASLHHDLWCSCVVIKAIFPKPCFKSNCGSNKHNEKQFIFRTRKTDASFLGQNYFVIRFLNFIIQRQLVLDLRLSEIWQVVRSLDQLNRLVKISANTLTRDTTK